MDLHRQTSHEHHEHYNLPHGYPLKPLGHNVESNVRGFINCQVGFTVIRESTFEGSTFKERCVVETQNHFVLTIEDALSCLVRHAELFTSPNGFPCVSSAIAISTTAIDSIASIASVARASVAVVIVVRQARMAPWLSTRLLIGHVAILFQDCMCL